MTRLGIVIPLEAEARALGLRGRPLGEIFVPATGVLVCISGIGPTRAETAASRLLAQGARALLSCGTAAALGATLAPGHLSLPQRVLHGHGEMSPVSPAWRRQLFDRLRSRFAITDGPLIASDHVLTGPEQKKQLNTDSGAVAADMESASVAAVADAAGVPFVALRTIADSADTAIPDWLTGELDEYGRVQVASFLRTVLRHPADWRRTLHVANDFRAAFATLRAIGNDPGCWALNPVLTGCAASASP